MRRVNLFIPENKSIKPKHPYISCNLEGAMNSFILCDPMKIILLNDVYTDVCKQYFSELVHCVQFDIIF